MTPARPILTTVCVLWATGLAAAQPSIEVLQGPALIGDYGWSVSDDGSVATGFGWGNRYWTRESGMLTSIATLYAVSGDGSTLVGNAGSPQLAFALWRVDNVHRAPVRPGGIATGANRDGSVVSIFAGPNKAWKPDAGTVVLLAPGTSNGYYAAAVSSDGRYIVGEQPSSVVAGHACRWDTQTGAIQALGPFTSPSTGSINVWARAVSADGSVIVGIAAGASAGRPAVRWTQETGWQALPTLGSMQVNHRAFGVSGDGSRVVGVTGVGAFIWFAPNSPTPQGVPTGIHDLNVLLPLLGVDLTGITLNIARGISGDGSTIVGDCRVAGQLRAFVATIQPPRCPADLDSAEGDGRPDGAVDINDLLFFLAAFEAGTSRADIDDNGLPPRIANGAVDINDLLYFLARFEAGC